MSDKKQDTFMELYQSCHESFVRYCSAISYGKMDTEDLVQDVLLNAYHHFDGIEQKEEMQRYLIRSAKNRMISLWRRKKFKGEYVDKQAERLRSQGCSAETLTDVGHLYAAMEHLSPSSREALILFEVSGFSMKEVAEMQGCQEQAVRTRVSRARKQLRALLSDAESEHAVDGKKWNKVMMLCL